MVLVTADLFSLIPVAFNNGNPMNRNSIRITIHFPLGQVALTLHPFAPVREHAVDNESRILTCATYPSADHSKMNLRAEFQGYENPKEIP